MPKALNGNYRKVDTPKANSYKVRVVRGVVSDHRAFFISYSKRIGVGVSRAWWQESSLMVESAGNLEPWEYRVE